MSLLHCRSEGIFNIIKRYDKEKHNALARSTLYNIMCNSSRGYSGVTLDLRFLLSSPHSAELFYFFNFRYPIYFFFFLLFLTQTLFCVVVLDKRLQQVTCWMLYQLFSWEVLLGRKKKTKKCYFEKVCSWVTLISLSKLEG